MTSVSLQEEKASQAPASIFVLSGDDLRAQGFRTLAEVLRSVPGLFVTDDTAYVNVGVRGLSVPGDQNTRFLVMLNGQPVNNSIGIGQGYLDRELPSRRSGHRTGRSDSGPHRRSLRPGRIHGCGQLRHPLQSRGGWRGAAWAPSSTRWARRPASLAGTVSGRLFDKLDVTAHVGGFRSRGGTATFPEWALYSDRVAPEGNQVRGAGWVVAENAFLSASWNSLTLELGYAHRKKNISSFPYGSVIGDLGTFYDNQSLFSSLAFQRQLGSFGVLTRVGFQDFHYADDFRLRRRKMGRAGFLTPRKTDGSPPRRG